VTDNVSRMSNSVNPAYLIPLNRGMYEPDCSSDCDISGVVDWCSSHAIHMGFILVKMALGEVSDIKLGFSLVNVIPSVLDTH
jgi:hypothetical protein